ncbi:MAG: AMP-dependent synthetase [Epsilonproteobacteria bacterium]|nr:MAG: AMP-dependent synthetase [Campylobacterota bacterium]
MSVNSVRNLLEIAGQTAPDKIALKHNSTVYTFAQLLTRVNQIAQYLNTLNLPKGSRIGIYSNKSSEQVIAILAILSTEYVLVPITRLLKPEQVKHIIDDADIGCLITDKSKIEAIKAIDFEGKVISYDTTEGSDVSFEEITKFYTGDISSDLKGFENAVITYSFSSSGNPKGIVIDHRALIDGARIVSKYLNVRSDDVISGLLSFNLDYGLNQIFTALYSKATLAIHKFVLSNDFFTHLINDKITVLPLMPIHITQMFDDDPHRIPSPEHLKNLRTITSSGGNITALMIKNITTHFPDAAFYSMHGLTEAFRSAYLDPRQIHIRPHSIGKAIPDVELYIINDEGEACKAREVGELIHRGAGIYKGYWNAPEETEKRFKSIHILDKVLKPEGSLTNELVVASGDYVYKDEEDYIYFVSRKDDMIKTQGFRVSPYEIENVVFSNIQDITECAVFSVPNDEIEEEIVMVYGAKQELARNEIIFELKKHLPNYMIPEQIIYRKNMPFKSMYDRTIDKEELKLELLKIL